MSGLGGVGRGGPRDHDFDLGPAQDAGAAQEAEAAPALPRSGWKDAGALQGAVRATKGALAETASRPNHRLKWVDAKRTGGDEPLRGVRHDIQLREFPGLRLPKPRKGGDRPVIVAKYGVPVRPTPGGEIGPDKPVIVAKYGVPVRPGGGGGKPDRPVITPKYGVPRPGPGGEPDRPVIVAKYGVPVPRN